MNRRYDRYLTIEQAPKVLNVDVNQVLGMLKTGELRSTSKGADAEEMVSSVTFSWPVGVLKASAVSTENSSRPATDHQCQSQSEGKYVGRLLR